MDKKKYLSVANKYYPNNWTKNGEKHYERSFKKQSTHLCCAVRLIEKKSKKAKIIVFIIG